jgi:hypothetical protein
MPVTSSYQWKHLFLPNGTLLRTIFNGKNFHCRVKEDHIRYNGQRQRKYEELVTLLLSIRQCSFRLLDSANDCPWPVARVAERPQPTPSGRKVCMHIPVVSFPA